MDEKTAESEYNSLRLSDKEIDSSHGFDRAIDRTRPSIREFISRHQRAETRLYRMAEAMEFDPSEVYDALERVQEEYDAFDGAKIRPICCHGKNYVAFELNGGDWFYLFDLILREIDNEEIPEYIARLTTKIMADITGEDYESQTALPLGLSESEIQDVLAYHTLRYENQSSREKRTPSKEI